MRTLTLVAGRKIELLETARPPTPAAGEFQIAIRAVGLNHIDLWGWRGTAFVKRKPPLAVGAEATGEIVPVGPGVDNLKAGDRVVPYGALTCGVCKCRREGRVNPCENVGGVMGFHIDGFARDLVNMPARLVVAVPPGVSADRLRHCPAHAVRQRQARTGRKHPGAGRWRLESRQVFGKTIVTSR
jgi:alcohol dehydrogenase